MGLQCAVLIGVFLILWLKTAGCCAALDLPGTRSTPVAVAMLLATIGSGVQYVVKAARLLGGATGSGK